MVFIEARSPAEVKKLARMGIDIASVREGPIVKDARGIPTQTYRIEAAVSIRDEKKLRHEGINWSDAAIKTHTIPGGTGSRAPSPTILTATISYTPGDGR